MEEGLKILNDVKFMLESAVVLIEHPGDGENKKKKVMNLVENFIKSNGIIIPIPMSMFNYMLEITIDWTVEWLNKNLWGKDEKTKDKE